jgi:predicted N-acetyltransferase YhbS
MPTYTIYSQRDFPAALKWQALAFMRVEWPSIFAGERLFVTETFPPELDPVHFVAAEKNLLIAYASIIRLDIEHAGGAYRVYGFGNMLTFPSFRDQGYGWQVAELATDFIKQSDVDIAALFCEPKRESFYARHGWQGTHAPTRIGTVDQYKVDEFLRMMLFVSEKGRQGREDFEEQPVYIDEPW